MDPFLGEIRLLPYEYAPEGWAFCNGQLMSIPQNSALFSLLSNTFGGQYPQTFALPNLQARAAMGAGTGANPSLTPCALGEAKGHGQMTLAANQTVGHTHSLVGTGNLTYGDQNTPTNNRLASGGGSGRPATVFSTYGSASSAVAMSAQALAPFGSTTVAAHENCQPYLGLNFCIAIVGFYPVRG